MTATAQLHGFEVAGRNLDLDWAALARAWMAEHRPEAAVLQTRTHTALYRGPDDLSARVTVEPVAAEHADEADGTLTLLIRSRHGATTVTEFPDDPSLPGLATMLDPRSALEVLARAAPGLWVGQREPEEIAHEMRCATTLVHHPRTGACVIRYDLSDAAGRPRQVYAKVYPSVAEARSSALAHDAVQGRRLSGRGVTVRLPRLLGLDIDTRTVLIESLGTANPRSTPVPHCDAAGVLRILHDASMPQHLPEVSAGDELALVRAEVELVRTGWPDLADRVAAHLDLATDELEQPAQRSVLSHGDFTPSQLLRLTPDVIGLLDLDTLRSAEPAADLGRYVAYAAIRSAGRGSAEDDHTTIADVYAVVTDAYGGTEGAPPDRVLAHARLHLALLALRATRRFKGERVRLALALLDHAPTRRPT